MTMIQQILDDASLSPTEKSWLTQFSDEVIHQATSEGPDFELSVFAIADQIGLDLTSIAKEGPLMCGLWVILLSILRENVPLEKLKYPTLESFLEVYEKFSSESEVEQERLWQTANWMSVLFQMIPAKKNKGLAMQVVPKLIEGWYSKYVTGSGQTRFTANRVHLFEMEGNTKANQRGKLKPKRKPTVKRQSSTRGRKRSYETVPTISPPLTKRKRMPKHSNTNSVSSVYSSASTGSAASVNNNQHHQQHIVNNNNNSYLELKEKERLFGLDPTIINPEVKEAFQLLRDQTCPNLARDESVSLGFNFEALLRSSSTFTGPSSLERGVSWNEIPVNNHSIGSNASSNHSSQEQLSANNSCYSSFSSASMPPPAPLSSNNSQCSSIFSPELNNNNNNSNLAVDNNNNNNNNSQEQFQELFLGYDHYQPVLTTY